jgi:hypothetical protein
MVTSQRPLDAIQFLTITIQSLPNELLTDIFRSTCTTVEQPPLHTPFKPRVLLDIPPPTSRFSETPKFSTFIATLLSSVCKRWRLVILSDLTLWSDVIISRRRTGDADFDGALKWAVNCTIRSYPTLMSLSVTDCFGGPQALTYLTQFINNNGQRIRELQAYLRITASFSQGFAKLQSPMPNLEVLEIGCSPHWGTPPDVGLPKIFSCNYPRLKHLSIQHFTTVPPRTFTNLATLVLSYSHGRVTLDNFLALIAGSPRLETLWVKKYTVTPSTNPHPPAPVPLPRLSLITLENCDSHLILSFLKIPGTATLRIMYAMQYVTRGLRITLADAFPLNPTIIGSLQNTRILSYGVDEATAVLFLKDSQGKKLAHVEQGHKVPQLGRFVLGRRLGPWFDTSFHRLFALDQAADLLASLTTLELDLRGLPNHDMGDPVLSFWLAFFKCTPLLEVLRASYLPLPAMLDGLNPSNKGRSVLCPSLRTVQLDIRTGAFDLKNDWLLQLIDTTRWRGKCGSPFRDVYVYLISSGYGHEFTLPSDAVRAMFSLRNAGVENMAFSNGTTTHRFGESPVLISSCLRRDSHFVLLQIRTISCCQNFHGRFGGIERRRPLVHPRLVESNLPPQMIDNGCYA